MAISNLPPDACCYICANGHQLAHWNGSKFTLCAACAHRYPVATNSRPRPSNVVEDRCLELPFEEVPF